MEYLMISGFYTTKKIKGINCYDDKSYSKEGTIVARKYRNRRIIK